MTRSRTYRAVSYAAVCCAVALLVRGLMKRANRAGHQSGAEYALGWPGPELVTMDSDGYIVPMAATNPNAATYRYTVGPTSVPSSLN